MNFFFAVAADVEDKGKTSETKTPVVEDFNNYKKSIAVISFEEDSSAVQPVIATIEIIESKVLDLINREVVKYLKTFFYSDTQDASIFNEKRIIDFLNTYQKICSAYAVSKKKQIRRLHKYCISATEQYIKSIFIGIISNGKKIRQILRQKFKELNFVQKIVILDYLKILKNTRRTKLNEVFRFIRKYNVAFRQLLAKDKLQTRMQSKGFFQNLSTDFAFDVTKKIKYDDENDDFIFFFELKTVAGKLLKSFKAFKKITNFAKQSFEMIKLIKNIENSKSLRTFRMKKRKMFFDVTFVNNRIESMIKTMKKIILNVNNFMQGVAKQQNLIVQYQSSVQGVIQIVRRSEPINVLQQNQQSAATIAQINEVYQKIYQNNQFMNSNNFERFFVQQQNDDESFSKKCFYCYKKNHYLKRNCKAFQKNITSDRIHIINKKVYFDFFRSGVFKVRMGMNRSQRACVKIAERFQNIVFAVSAEFVTFVAFANNVNTIFINIDFLKKISSDDENDEKNELFVVTLNHASIAEMSILFTVVVQALTKSKKSVKQIKILMKKVLNKQIEKKKNLFRPKTLRSKKWKSVSESVKPVEKTSIFDLDEVIMIETLLFEHERQQIKMIVSEIILLKMPKTKKFEIVDSAILFKMRKSRAFFKSRMTDFGKLVDDNDDFIKKIKEAEMTLNFEKLVAYASTAHKLFTMSLFEKQALKLSVRSLKINIKKKKLDSGYSCASLRVGTIFESKMRTQAFLNFEIEINFMSADIQKILKRIMHALSAKIFISFQSGHLLNLVDVMPHVKMKIEEFNTLHHVFVVKESNHSFVLKQSFLIATSVNYDYRDDEIYAIFINPELIRSAVVKMMNRHDKQNKDRSLMYDYSAILKDKTTFL